MCWEVLAAVAAERGEADAAATQLGNADRLRCESGVAVPAFLQADVATTRERVT